MQWRIQRGPNSWPSEEKLWESLSSWLIHVSTLAVIKFVAYSLPWKIMFSILFCSNSSEPQPAWNVRVGRGTGGLDLDVLQCRSKHSDRPEARRTHQNTHFETLAVPPGEGALAPTPPHIPPQWWWEDPLPILHPIYSRLRRLYSCAFGARLGPLETQILDPALIRGVLLSTRSTNLIWHLT